MSSAPSHFIEKTVTFQWDAAKRGWFAYVYDTPPSDRMHMRSQAYRLLIPIPPELTEGRGTVVGHIEPIEP
jgi:hypothetical protein